MEHWSHPCDGVLSTERVVPRHLLQYGHLVLRISWKKGDDGFIPMTFVCATGMSEYVYLCADAKKCLKEAGLLHADDEREFVRVCGGKMPVSSTPAQYAPANMLGLGALMQLGMTLHRTGFSFASEPPYF